MKNLFIMFSSLDCNWEGKTDRFYYDTFLELLNHQTSLSLEWHTNEVINIDSIQDSNLIDLQRIIIQGDKDTLNLHQVGF